MLGLFLIQTQEAIDGMGKGFAFYLWAAESEKAASEQFALLFPVKRVVAIYSLPPHAWVEKDGRLDLLFVKLEDAE